jgi:hypothetical protein
MRWIKCVSVKAMIETRLRTESLDRNLTFDRVTALREINALLLQQLVWWAGLHALDSTGRYISPIS